MEIIIVLLVIYAIYKFYLRQKMFKLFFKKRVSMNFADKNQPEKKVIEALPYLIRDDFLSSAEKSFYLTLRTILEDKGLEICPKVSLKDIFFINMLDFSKKTTYLNKIARKHVDFLICSSKDMKIICGVELDDSSHNNLDRTKRDLFVNEVFDSAGLKLIRVPNRIAYNVGEIKDYFADILDSKSTSSLQENFSKNMEIPICPKCGIPMILRTTNRGPKKGSQFFGCANFPKCKEVSNFRYQK